MRVVAASTRERLQWGRSFDAAESRARPARSGSRRRRFNGAAALMPRRAACSRDSLSPAVALQWGRSFDAAERCVAIIPPSLA